MHNTGFLIAFKDMTLNILWCVQSHLNWKLKALWAYNGKAPYKYVHYYYYYYPTTVNLPLKRGATKSGCSGSPKPGLYFPTHLWGSIGDSVCTWDSGMSTHDLFLIWESALKLVTTVPHILIPPLVCRFVVHQLLVKKLRALRGWISGCCFTELFHIFHVSIRVFWHAAGSSCSMSICKEDGECQ
jgi:hypothetical protein